MVVRLEEITANPADWMPRIRAHLELPADAPATFQKHNSSFENAPAMQADLTRAETTWLRLVLGKYAKKLDFELPPRRFAPIGMLMSVCALFPWVVRNWSFMSQRNSGGVRDLIRRWLR